MDLNQKKLTKSEWMNIEIPVEEKEKKVLELIIDGYSNINLRRNDTPSLLSYMKIEHTPEIELYLFRQYFEKDIDLLMKEESGNPSKNGKKERAVIKTRDLIRIQSIDGKIEQQKDNIFEFIMVNLCKEILTSFHKKTSKYAFYLYTVIQLKKSTIPLLNKYVMEFVDHVIARANRRVSIREVLHHSYDFIEKNENLLAYEDRTLFQHQKQLFSIFKSQNKPKLVLYIAPTGTGKTLSPIGLASEYRIIFVCAARHIGLALAKSAISVNKRVAFAFGCETASDIRLHYFAASSYTRNKRTGGIGKVDNSVGDKVEIMICDVQSYLIAMRYMLAFSEVDEETEEPDDGDLITYWDEPTITMDYETHELHDTIHKNWTENKISKVVLSCATLPKENEIMETISNFRERFIGAEIHNIVSYDCKKSISILNKNGFSILPHLTFREYSELQKCVEHCIENKTLLRYFDLNEIVRFIDCLYNRKNAIPSDCTAESYFADSVGEITMNNVKLYYLELLKRLDPAIWPSIYDELVENWAPRFSKTNIRKTKSMDVFNLAKKTAEPLSRTHSMAIIGNSDKKPSVKNQGSGILFTTEDASTLTDGPTIFLVEDVEKVSRFYIQQTNIPARIFHAISEKIAQNSILQKRIDILTKQLEDKEKSGGGSKRYDKDGKEVEKDKKYQRDDDIMSSDMKRILEQISAIRSEVRNVAMDQIYIPNTTQHQRVWNSNDEIVSNAFVPSVDEESVRDIMMLGVSDQNKLLLLLGIGVFTKDASIQTGESNTGSSEEKNGSMTDADHLAYMEVMKRLAYKQQLYLILASSDYIYGTNYQFCHGIIGKDLTNMTQQKTIQAMGRIGRNQMQQEYTIRFRDDEMLSRLFQTPEFNREAEVMSRLFS